jgi:uncharacterized protein
MEMCPVVHFELPAEQGKRMAAFYEHAFGWQVQQLGPENGGYMLATTAERDVNGFPKETGRINGGFYGKTPDITAQHPSVVIAVKDIQASMKKVQEEGGKVLGEPMDIPGYGMYVSFLDTEGNKLSMMQPSMQKSVA